MDFEKFGKENEDNSVTPSRATRGSKKARRKAREKMRRERMSQGDSVGSSFQKRVEVSSAAPRTEKGLPLTESTEKFRPKSRAENFSPRLNEEISILSRNENEGINVPSRNEVEGDVQNMSGTMSREQAFNAFLNDEMGEYDNLSNRELRKEEKARKKEARQDQKEVENRGKKPKKKKKKIVIALRIILITIMLLILAAGASAYYVMSMLGDTDYVKLTKEELDIDPKVSSELANYRNILLAGVDARAGESYDESRTDALIIISINEETDDIRLISIYRDTYLDQETKEGKHILGKITEANSRGGIKNTIRAINRNMDLNIEEFMVVNWKSVADVVDGLGGVDVEVLEEEIPEMNKYIVDTNATLEGDPTEISAEGMQTLNGVQAVTFSRIRKVGNGDFERTERMRTIINATASKARETGFRQLHKVSKQALSELRTNMDAKQLLLFGYEFATGTMGENLGWPYLDIETNLYMTATAVVNGASIVVPVTLEKNVVKLHEEMFGLQGYEPTERVLEISRQIISKSGKR